MNNNLKRLLFVSTIIILLITIASVNAADNNITSNQADTMQSNSDNDYDIVKADNKEDKTNISVEKQIKTATTVNVKNYTQLYETLNDNKYNNCTINLQRGLYIITEEYPPSLYENSNIIINGNSSIIFGAGQYTFIETEGQLTLNNITIRGCNEAIRGYDNSAIVLNNSNFTDNNATFNSILYSSGDVGIYNCNFNHNGAADTAIMNINGLEIEEIKGNTVISYHGTLDIRNTTFTNNYNKETSDYEEGYLFNVNNKKTTIQNCTFNKLSNSYSIKLDIQDTLTISNNNFNNLNSNKKYDENKTDIYQQPILEIYGHNKTNINIKDNTFNNITFKTNVNTRGSIIRCIGDYNNSQAKLNITKNKFTNININSTSDNEANVEGGIIYAYNTYCTINNNTFKTSINNSNVYGGVLRIDADKAINNTFINNTVQSNIKNIIIEEDLNNKEVFGGVIFNCENSNLTTDDYKNNGQITAEIVENTTTYNEGNLSILGKLEAILGLNVPKQADTGQTITLNLTINGMDKKALSGKAAVKLNGITMKDVKTNSSIIQLTNGKGSITISLAGISGDRDYKINAVFSKSGYARIENTTYIRINKQSYKAFTLTYNASSEEVIRIKQTLKDKNGNIIYGNTKVAIKLGDRTVKTLTVTNGQLDTTVTVPYLPPGTNKFIITLGDNYRYNSVRVNNTINIHKQNVTVTITQIKAKAGTKITLKATLKNKDTKTNVISGKYIFKVNGKTVPLIVNNKEVITTQNVQNGIAQWSYTIPKTMQKGTYNITLSYNGNTQSNSVKYTSKALTII
ncbi:MAG: hypothetical protein E7Z86_08145 [Methanosphaera stadtmanae]|nr:hypothetical protein [Methanosphaera stadtmanae]